MKKFLAKRAKYAKKGNYSGQKNRGIKVFLASFASFARAAVDFAFMLLSLGGFLR
jgi:hypothetical protein